MGFWSMDLDTALYMHMPCTAGCLCKGAIGSVRTFVLEDKVHVYMLGHDL